MTTAATTRVISSRRTRAVSMVLTIGIHLGLVALMMLPAENRATIQTAALTMFDVPPGPLQAQPAASKPPQPKPVPPTPPQPVVVPPPAVPLPVPHDTLVALLEQSEAAAPSGACDLTAPVQAALQASEAVRVTLPRIPRDKRSVANAIMLWKTAWLAEDQQLDATAVAAIREVVSGTIAAATPECRLQPQVGPRLLLLHGSDDTVVLAVGSGAWRWQDLVAPALPASVESARQLPSWDEPANRRGAPASIALR